MDALTVVTAVDSHWPARRLYSFSDLSQLQSPPTQYLQKNTLDTYWTDLRMLMYILAVITDVGFMSLIWLWNHRWYKLIEIRSDEGWYIPHINPRDDIDDVIICTLYHGFNFCHNTFLAHGEERNLEVSQWKSLIYLSLALLIMVSNEAFINKSYPLSAQFKLK